MCAITSLEMFILYFRSKLFLWFLVTVLIYDLFSGWFQMNKKCIWLEESSWKKISCPHTQYCALYHWLPLLTQRDEQDLFCLLWIKILLGLEVFHRFAKLAFSSLTGLIWASAGLRFGPLTVLFLCMCSIQALSQDLRVALDYQFVSSETWWLYMGRKDGIPVLSTTFLN